MLADDPEHRPTPSLLMDPTAARARRVASRPPAAASRPLVLNDIPVFDSQTLAYAMLGDEKKSVQALRSDIGHHLAASRPGRRGDGLDHRGTGPRPDRGRPGQGRAATRFC